MGLEGGDSLRCVDLGAAETGLGAGGRDAFSVRVREDFPRYSGGRWRWGSEIFPVDREGKIVDISMF